MRPFAIAGVIIIVAGAVLFCAPAAAQLQHLNEEWTEILQFVSNCGAAVMVFGVVVAIIGFVRELLNR